MYFLSFLLCRVLFLLSSFCYVLFKYFVLWVQISERHFFSIFEKVTSANVGSNKLNDRLSLIFSSSVCHYFLTYGILFSTFSSLLSCMAVKSKNIFIEITRGRHTFYFVFWLRMHCKNILNFFFHLKLSISASQEWRERNIIEITATSASM